MELCDLLEVKKGVTALIGGGGKTTLMYRLTDELKRRGTVVVCTTTRIYPPTHLPILRDPTAAALRAALHDCPVLCVGSDAPEGKLASCTLSPAELAESADYVLTEADGAKHLPLKAHENHEPVIPEGCENVILVVGADGFGKPIEKVCHRPERYAALLELDPTDDATPERAAALCRLEALHTRIFVNKAEKNLPAVRQFAAAADCPVCAGSLKEEWLLCLR